MNNEFLKIPLNLKDLVQYSAILVPGTLVSIVFYSFFANLFNKIKYLPSTLIDNPVITTFLFVVIIFSIGSYIYISSTRVFSYYFEKALKKKEMRPDDNGHNHWRHFFMSCSLAFLIILILRLLYLLTIINAISALGLTFFFSGLTIVSFLLTYFLHTDLLSKKEVPNKNDDKKWMTLSVDSNKKRADITFF